MVRATWVKPMTLVQKFEANEAVAACMQITCESDTYLGYQFPKYVVMGYTYHPAELDGENPWGRDEWLGVSGADDWRHSNHSCKDPNNSGVTISNDGQISLASDCELALHVDIDNDGLADIGERIYWREDEKSGLYTYKFNHWGTVTQSSNHS